MSESIKGQLTIQNSNGSGTAVLLNGDALPQKGLVIAGQNKPTTGGKPAKLQPPSFLTGQLDIKDNDGKVVMSLGISELKFQNKTVLRSGLIGLTNAGADDNKIVLNGSGFIKVGGAGLISVNDTDDNKRIELSVQNGGLIIYNSVGKKIVQVNADDADNGSLKIFNSVGETITQLDGNGLKLSTKNGEIFLNDSGWFQIGKGLWFSDGLLNLGGNSASGIDSPEGHVGRLHLRNASGAETIIFESDASIVRLGGAGTAGRIVLWNQSDNETIVLDSSSAKMGLGGSGMAGRITMQDQKGVETLRIDGQTGDVILQNADCAEDFDLAAAEACVPGAVMTLDNQGKLKQCRQQYDSAVAGVVSGAGNYRPGIVLDRRSSDNPRAPLAMMGKVFCQVDACFGAIEPGDLLTTSSTPGHAMRVGERERAVGAVLGKALGRLASGQGLIPILVALQ